MRLKRLLVALRDRFAPPPPPPSPLPALVRRWWDLDVLLAMAQDPDVGALVLPYALDIPEFRELWRAIALERDFYGRAALPRDFSALAWSRALTLSLGGTDGTAP